MSPYDGKERYPVANPILWGSSGGLTRAGATQALDLSVPFLPDSAAVVDLQNGVMTRIWLEFHRRVVGTLTNMALAVSTIPNATSGTIAQQPTGLGPTQAGLIYNVLPPYAHVMRWNGTAWEFAPGDHGSGHIIPYLVLPGNPTCWQECDGTATDYLVAGGATITTAPFTTPDLKTSNRYIRGAATAGQLLAAQAAAITMGGSIALSGALASEASHVHLAPSHTHGLGGGSAPAHTHTFTSNSHTHGFSGTTGGNNQNASITSGTTNLAPAISHDHNFSGTTGGSTVNGTTDSGGGGALSGNTDTGSSSQNTSAGSAHTHGLGTLAATPALTATGDLSAVPLTYTVRFYFRR